MKLLLPAGRNRFLAALPEPQFFIIPLILAMIAGVCASGLGAVPPSGDPGLVGYWPFDSTLADASGHGRNAQGKNPEFAPGTKGMALASKGKAVTVANDPDLQLTPGLEIDCWVYWDQPPTGYEPIVLKDKEYQLRVDGADGSGRLAFFVYLDGWEPRVHGPVPEAGKWYHLIARWTGTEATLEVNGEVKKV